MTDETNLAGGCACGAVRYRMQSEPLIVHCCHCTWCQRETGSAFALNAMIEADRVTLLQGEPERVATPSNSGKGQDIFRCATCRVAVWSNYGGAGDKIHFVRVGTLDAGHALQPDVHIYTSTKQPWVMLPDGQPVFDEYYRRSECWSDQSIARVTELFA
jgi:hypothetical protein